jgi:hypothetical protein
MQRCLLIGLATDVTAREREFESRSLANRFYKLKALLDEGETKETFQAKGFTWTLVQKHYSAEAS